MLSILFEFPSGETPSARKQAGQQMLGMSRMLQASFVCVGFVCLFAFAAGGTPQQPRRQAGHEIAYFRQVLYSLLIVNCCWVVV